MSISDYENAAQDYADTHGGDATEPTTDWETDHPFEDPVSVTSETFATGPGSAEPMSADEAALAATPSGVDYRADPTLKVTDVLEAQEYLDAHPELLAVDDSDEGWLDDLEAEWADDEQTAPDSEEVYTAAQALADYTGSTLEQIYEWCAKNPTLVPQAVAEVKGHHAEQQQLQAQMDRIRTATAEGNAPAVQRAEEILAAQQADEVRDTVYEHFANIGVHDPDAAWQAAEQACNELTAQGVELSQADAVELVLQAGEAVRLDERSGPMTAQKLQRDFGGHVRANERPTVTSMFFHGKG